MQELMSRPRPSRPMAWAYSALTALMAALSGLLVAASVATAADFSWSGEGSASANTWSNSANWMGGTAPAASSAIGTLVFPVLNRSACLQAKPSEACYTSDNDLTGLSVNALQVDDSHDYGIVGAGFTLGSGGLSINSSEGTGGQFNNINFSIINPITLGGSQTWSVSGPPTVSAWPAQNIAIRSTLSGPSSDLTVNLNSLTNFVFGIDVPGAPSVDDEIGNIAINGSEATVGSSTYKYKSLVVIAPNAKLNATDGKRLSVNTVNLEGQGATGPITASQSSVSLEGPAIGPLTAIGSWLSLNGQVASLTLNKQSSLSVGIVADSNTPDNQVTSAGAINLGGSALELFSFQTTEKTCPPPPVGRVYTIISTTGSLNGSFGNTPDGSTVTAECVTAGPSELPTTGRVYSYRINYHTSSSPETVTLTALPAVPVSYAAEPPTISGTTTESQTLSESHALWANNPTSYSYQWQRCDSSGNNCQAITAAANQTYTLTNADVGHTIRVQETASNSEGSSRPAVSAPTAVVQAASSSSGQNSGGTAGNGTPSGSGTSSGGSTPSVSTEQLKASLVRQLMPSGKGAKIAALLKSGGYLLPFTALEAGTLTVGWYYLPHGAKLAKRSKAKPVLIAYGKLTFSGATTGKLKLALTTKGKRLLRHAKRVSLTVRGIFTPKGGAALVVIMKWHTA